MGKSIRVILCLACMGIAGFACYYYATTVVTKRKRKSIQNEVSHSILHINFFHNSSMIRISSKSHYKVQIRINYLILYIFQHRRVIPRLKCPLAISTLSHYSFYVLATKVQNDLTTCKQKGLFSKNRITKSRLDLYCLLFGRYTTKFMAFRFVFASSLKSLQYMAYRKYEISCFKEVFHYIKSYI